MYNHNPNELCRRFVNVDETWIHHITPETQGTDETVHLSRRIEPEGQQGHGDSFFFGFARCHIQGIKLLFFAEKVFLMFSIFRDLLTHPRIFRHESVKTTKLE